ncbi:MULTISPECIES: ABC transporter permease [Inquilinus]|uniref:Glycine betaine/proline transport system permease protein n=1 Tax=Inquilinus ginsengisoli TaxID=363840 RepID=A0ABU1JK20_9PROT|nr:proline/glycine betaine ABC transporter permease [Inquilinus ginsengisoli]MDR6288962.1 glycine betaine/proline transport system permease protein [Inquilinus ginsengisoli]
MFDADDLYVLPVDKWIQAGVQWMSQNLRPFFQTVKWPVEHLLGLIEHTLQGIPFPVFVVLAGLIAWKLSSRGVALFTVVSLVVIAFTGVWTEAITTLALITTAIVICVCISVPIGILCARSDAVWRIVRPVLDVMQTTPTFVYLVPIVMMFGVGTVPGEVAVIMAAAPPLIRFTNLGIRMVDKEMVEAGLAFGATGRQLLWEVQLPLAMPTILGGLNQTVLTAMVMSVVVAMIGAEGLGLVVLQGLGRLDVGRAAVGGLAIVLLAMTLDRITQSLAKSKGGKGVSLRAVLLRLVGRQDDRAQPAVAGGSTAQPTA